MIRYTFLVMLFVYAQVWLAYGADPVKSTSEKAKEKPKIEGYALTITPGPDSPQARFLNKSIPDFRGENWTPKQFFAILSNLTNTEIGLSTKVTNGAPLSPKYANSNVRTILEQLSRERGWSYEMEERPSKDDFKRTAVLTVSMLKVFSAMEKPPLGALRAIKTVQLTNMEPEKAREALLASNPSTGIAFISATRRVIILEYDPESISKMEQALHRIDRTADAEITRIVQLKNREAVEIVKEVEKLLPDQEGNLIPDSADSKIYLRDTPDTVARLEKLINELDQGQNPAAPQMAKKVIKVQRAAADLVVKDLINLMPELNGAIKADPVENTITLTGDSGRWDALERLIQGLDVGKQQEPAPEQPAAPKK